MESIARVIKFGGSITTVDKILGVECESKEDSRISYEEQRCCRNYIMSANQKPRRISTGDSKELIEACQDIPWNHDMNTPHRQETNGVAERAVRRVKGRTAAMVVQSDVWRKNTMEPYCSNLRNVRDTMAGDRTACENGLV